MGFNFEMGLLNFCMDLMHVMASARCSKAMAQASRGARCSTTTFCSLWSGSITVRTFDFF